MLKNEQNDHKSNDLKSDQDIQGGLNNFIRNAQELSKMSLVLNSTFQENTEISNNNKKLISKLMNNETELDETRMTLFDLTTELSISLKSNQLKDTELEEKRKQIKIKTDKIEKLMRQKEQLEEENAELRIRLNENMERLQKTLEKIKNLTDENLRIQTSFEDQNQKILNLLNKNEAYKKTQQDLKQEKRIQDKLVKEYLRKTQQQEADLEELKFRWFKSEQNAKIVAHELKKQKHDILMKKTVLNSLSQLPKIPAFQPTINSIKERETRSINDELQRRVIVATDQLKSESARNKNIQKKIELYETIEKPMFTEKIKTLRNKLKDLLEKREKIEHEKVAKQSHHKIVRNECKHKKASTDYCQI